LAGIYIHIPFCRQACTYCNFHFSVSTKNKAALINTINKEITLSKDFIKDTKIETIYFGGGTPSMLTEIELLSIFKILQNKFTIADDAEITLEANPDDINTKMLGQWKTAGINRLSVGLQSFNEAELKWMNRAHNATQSLQCLDDIEDAGFTNYSVDLIYGSPLQTNEDLKNNFTIIAQRNIPHISCYALTVENGTVLNKLIQEKKSPNVNTDKQAAQFHLLLEMMEANGYEQYEISNFSKPSYRSKHNSSYWQGKPYFGFGPSAHSYNGIGIRRWNVSNNSLYIQSLEKNIIPYEEEILTDEDCVNEYVMTSLRTVEGINVEILAQKFGIKNKERILFSSKKYIEQGRLIYQNTTLQLTKEGKFFADGIAADLFC
jgi:putative oxygen-independent coproporphyrinogen III oxidase